MGVHPGNEGQWRVEGVVLAGGASRRMGRDKSLIEVDGVPMIRRVATALLDGGCGAVRVVGGDAGALAALGLSAVADAYPGEGPLGGIATALGATAADAVMVVACDLPSLSADTVRTLIAASRLETSRVIVARSSRLEPLCAVWPRAVAEVVGEVFHSGGRAVAAALDRLEVSEVAVPVSDLRNLNTPADVAEMQSHHGIA